MKHFNTLNAVSFAFSLNFLVHGPVSPPWQDSSWSSEDKPCSVWTDQLFGSFPLNRPVFGTHSHTLDCSWKHKSIRIQKSLKQDHHKNEGTAKAEELDQLQCLWGWNFFGMHIRKNSCGWKNKENKYCLEQYLFMLEITRCRAFLPGWLRCGSDWFTVKRPPMNK